jgi:uncharacterized RDD family membrane protein YckC
MANEETLQDARYAPPQAHVADVETQAEGPLLATRAQRFGAAVIDGALAFASVWVAAKLTPWNPWDMPPEANFWTVTPVMNMVVGLLLFFLIHGFLLATRGQTVGKLALGIRIVRPDGSRVSVGRIGLRYSIGYATTVVPIVGQIYNIADCLLIFRSNRRCLHDLIADTIVVKA